MNAHTSGSVFAGQYEAVVGSGENPRLQGRFGLVYSYVDQGEGDRPVVLKTYRPEFVSRQPRFETGSRTNEQRSGNGSGPVSGKRQTMLARPWRGIKEQGAA